MDEFLHAIRGGFAEDREHASRLGWVFAILIAAAILAWLVARWVRAARARAALRAFAAAHSFLNELPLVLEMAKRAQLEPRQLLENVDLFERATRLALEAAPDRQLAERIGNIRRGLGYDHLSSLTPLYTSRELQRGAELLLGTNSGRVTEVSERSFSLEVPAPRAEAAGETVVLDAPHAREAPYRLHCRLLERGEETAGRARLVFAHDESPQRVAVLEARAAAHGAITLRPAMSSGAGILEETKAELLEVNTHELVISSKLRVPEGHLFDCSFSLGLQRFSGLRAVALAEEPGVHEVHRVRLELRGLSEHERERLRKAIEA